MLRDVLQDLQRDRLRPETVVRKGVGVSRQRAFEMMSNLTLQLRAFVDQIASMPHKHLQTSINIVPRLIQQSEAIHRSAKDGDEIIVIGLDVAVLGGSIMTRRERMHDACVVPGCAKCTPDNLVIRAGHFDCDNRVFDAMLFNGLLQREQRQLNLTASMLNAGWRDEDSSVKICEHPLRSILRTVHTDDTEMLRSRLLHTLLNLPRRLPHHGCRKRFGASLCSAFSGFDFRNHCHCLSVKKCSANISQKSSWRSPIVFYFSGATYQGAGCAGINRFGIENESFLRKTTGWMVF